MEIRGVVRADRPLLVVALADEGRYLPAELPVLVTGVGKIRAAVAVTQALSGAVTPREVVNLGTAGALVDGFSGTYVIGRVVQHDFDNDAIRAIVGSDQGGPLDLGGDGPVLATGDQFVSDPALRERLARDASLCDMEGYAVAAAALACGVPVRLVKHVSDPADETALRSWQETLDSCARALGDWAGEHLSPVS